MASILHSMFMCAIKYGENEQMLLHERPPHMHRDVNLLYAIFSILTEGLIFIKHTIWGLWQSE